MRHVLLINSYHTGFYYSDGEQSGVRSMLSTRIDLAVEYMDTKRILDADYLDLLYQIYRYKYRDRTFDCIVTLDDNAFQFMLMHRDDLFPGVPWIFGGINYFQQTMLAGQTNVTGIIETTDQERVLTTALNLYPQAKQVWVVTDHTTSGENNRHNLENLIHLGRIPVDVFFYDPGGGLSYAQLREKVANTPPDSLIYYSDFFQDGTGEFFPYEEIIPDLSQIAPAPIFVHAGYYIGHGAVGGHVISGFYHGQAIGDLVNRALAGESIGDIPIEPGPTIDMFDYTQLKRWKIPVSRLPEHSVVLNKPESVYEEYKNVIWGTVLFLVTQAVVIGILVTNITRRRRVERILRESEERYRNLVEFSPIPIFVYRDERFIYLNPAAVILHGAQYAEDLIGQPLTNFVRPDTRSILKQRIAQARSQPYQIRHSEIQLVRLDQQVIDLAVTSMSVNYDGELAQLVICVDITDRKRAEERIHKLNEALEQRVQERTAELHAQTEQSTIILQNIDDAIVLTDPRARIIYVNPAWEKMTGYMARDVQNLTPSLLQSGSTPSGTYEELWKTLRAGEIWQGLVYNRRKDGVPYDAELTIVPVRDGQGTITNYVGVQRDVTAARRLEAMKARFIADAAHDLNNPIASLSLRLYMMKRMPQDIDHHLAVMERQIEYLMSLVNDLLTLSRLDRNTEELVLSPVGLNGLVNSIIDMQAPLAHEKNITLGFEPDTNLTSISADQKQIERVITNLVANALNYTHQDGAVTIQTWQTDNWAVLSITDTGIGILPDDMPHVFERFYRSDNARETAPGTGLGLSIVKEIVDMHGGRIEVTSEPHQGTCFQVYLPVHPRTVPG